MTGTDPFAAALADNPAKVVLDYMDKGLLPLWAERGWDRAGAGGFHERLNPEGLPVDGPFQRVMAAGRQLFVFSRGFERFGRQDYAELAHRIYGYLTAGFWDQRHRGWHFSLDSKGAPFSRKKDLYGHAFVMFGLAHYHAVFDDQQAVEHALRTDGVIRERLLLDRGWFASAAEEDWSAPVTELTQNPHMHLLEAYLALFRATGQSLFRDRANELIGLFFDRLFDRQRGVLLEFLDSDGRPHPTHGHELEPGHHFEWYWLLNEAADLLEREDCRIAGDRLLSWANDHGIDEQHGGAFDQVDPSGRVLTATKRIWPQTERIKAQATRFRRTGSATDRTELLAQLDFLFRHYLRPDGGWLEMLDTGLQPIKRDMPASTPYHLVMAFEEALKVLES